MTTKTVVVNNGIGLMGLLFITLFVMKILGYINYSWWIVTAPLWGPTALIIVILLVVMVVVFLASTILTLINKNKDK